MEAITHSFKEFGDLRNRLAAVLAGEVEVFETLDQQLRAQSVRDASQKLERERFRIVVMGALKHGKSTFINALMGEAVVPTKFGVPCTAVPISIRYGIKRRAVCYKRATEGETIELALPEQSKEFLEASRIPTEDWRIDPKDEDHALANHWCERIEMEYPIDLLRQGVELQDSPGLNENAGRTRATWNQVGNADAVLLILDINVVSAKTDRDDLRKIMSPDRDPRVVFAVWNKMDDCEKKSSAEDVENVRRAATALAESVGIVKERVFFVSAEKSLEGRISSDLKMLEMSGMPAFERALAGFMGGEKTASKLRSALHAAETFSEEARSGIAAWSRDAAMEAEKAKDVAQRAESRLRRGKAIQTTLTSRLEEAAEFLASEVGDAVSGFVNENREQIEGALGKVELGFWDAVSDKKASARRLVGAAEEWLNARARTWQRERIMPSVRKYRSTVRRDLTEAMDQSSTLAEEVGKMRRLVSDPSATELDAPGDDDSADDPNAVSRVVNDLLSGITGVDSEDLSLFANVGIGAAIGGVLGTWVSGILFATLGPVALIGAAIGALFGIGSAGERLKRHVAAKIGDALAEGEEELQRKLCAAVRKGGGQVSKRVKASFDERLKSIKQSLEMIEAARDRAEAAAASREAIAVTLLERLDQCSVELADLRDTIHPPLNRRQLVEDVRHEVAHGFDEIKEIIRGTNVVDESDPAISKLKRTLGKTACDEYKKIVEYLKEKRGWEPQLELQVLEGWVACHEAFSKSPNADVQVPLYCAIIALVASWCRDSSAEPTQKELRDLYLDLGFRHDLEKLLTLLGTDELAKLINGDPPGGVSKGGERMLHYYRRTLKKLHPDWATTDEEPRSAVRRRDVDRRRSEG